MTSSNLEFGEWPKVFGDEKMRVAMLDRLARDCGERHVHGRQAQGIPDTGHSR
jgi:DNA replication protein DnaC